MPEYIAILRQSSVFSIYALIILVLIATLFKGLIKDRELSLVYYVWLPIAVVTQILMTYIRLSLGKSNLPVMNIYLIFEFSLLIYILLQIRSRQKGTENNYKLWAVIIIGGILIHFLDPIDKLHNAAMLYIALVYFHLSVGFIDLNKIDKLIKDPFSILHIAIFTKAFGYSYFLIYQIDYKFPLAIYSGVNLIVQILFAATIISYYKDRNSKIPDRIMD